MRGGRVDGHECRFDRLGHDDPAVPYTVSALSLPRTQRANTCDLTGDSRYRLRVSSSSPLEERLSPILMIPYPLEIYGRLDCVCHLAAGRCSRQWVMTGGADFMILIWPVIRIYRDSNRS
jgi:hypothetical protein